MKKLFLTVAVALSALAVNAQDMWVGGTAGVWSSKVKGADSELSFKVLPEFGFVVNENIGVGISVGGAHLHDEYYSSGEAGHSSKNLYVVNPFVRYTFLKSTLGGMFVDGGFGYSWSKGTNGGAKGTEIEVGLRPGLALNVSNKVALISKFGFLGYQHTKLGATKTNGFGFDLDLSNIQLGANIKF